MGIYRRTNGWFDDDDPCLNLSWRRTIVIWSPFDPITVPLLARKSITKHVLLRANRWRMDIYRRTNGWFDDDDPCLNLSWKGTIIIWSTFLCLLESPSRNMFFFAQIGDAWICIGGQSGDSTMTIPVRGFVVKKNNHHLITFRTNHGSSAC